ncbi:hypothetical protein GGI35DRAFT_458088, partial [Trichoderma velutinum]
MIQQFSGQFTFIPTEPIPGSADINRYNHTGLYHGRKHDKCDFCYLSSTGLYIPCIPDNSSPYGHVCVLCSLFNRPCTFTIGGELATL